MITNNSTYDHLINYLHREVDTTTKLTYYFAVHLFEWMNATAVYKPVNSYGYLKPDGTYDGIIGELMAGTSHFSVVMFFMTKERMNAVEYVVSPSRVSVIMLFRKPSLASVTNIYSLPFHIGVWLAVMSLTFVSSVALTGSTYWEDTVKNRPRNSLMKQFTQSVYETLGGIVFQQGTSVEPQSVSSRQVVLLSLMAFMFLHTAYSANVVALLQSATDISGPEGILNSPMEYGATDIIYNHHIFKNEHRPVHRALWLKKGLPQGDKFFSTVEEGIRRVREGMYAFHVEQTAGFDEVQRTFLEHEKCNLGYFSYVSFPMPHLGVSKVSQYKELLRIGAFLLKERGVQARSSNRLVAPPPKCAAGTAFFTAVGIQDVAPAFLLLITIYSLVIVMFALEVVLHRYELKKEQNKEVRTILVSRNTQATIATP
uniref:Putative ionotropic receptor 5 n=1 Tax=Conopomorpha sinensis TaxID=940481 RepID=A0A3S7SGU2_9NEOP|nr:putative ionotropic receptor 5 [Conopomorpha sinensis]